MRTILTLALKDLRVMTRDWFGMFWIVVFPLIYALFFGAIFGGASGGEGRSLKVAFIDEEDSAGSRAFGERLQERKSAITLQPSTPAEAMEAVRKGNLIAFVTVKSGFGQGGNPFTGGPRHLEIGIDPSRQAEGEMLKGLLMDAMFGDLKSLFSQPGKEWVKLDVQDVTRRRSGPRAAWEVSFPQSVLWAIMGGATGFAISLVIERTQGTFLRLRTAPVSFMQLLAGKGLACFLTCAGVTVLLLVVGAVGLGLRLGNPLHLAAAVVCTALCFTGIMMWMSTLGKTEQGVAGAGWGIMMPMAMIGGGMVPLFVMPGWLQSVSHISPVKWGIYALEGAIWRDFSTTEMLLPCGILLAVGVVGFTLGVWTLSRREG